MPGLWQDARFAVRMLRKSPGFSAVIVATLAVGIGINTTVFTLANAVLFKGLPFHDGKRIVLVSATRPDERAGRHISLSYPEYRDYLSQARSFRGMAAFQLTAVNLGDDKAAPERYLAGRMAAGSFALTGVRPVLGRDFQPADENPGAARIAIVSHTVWQNRYGGKPGILGTVVRIDGVPAEIVGVMPPGFRFPLNNDVWLPLTRSEDRASRTLSAFARLAPGATVESARAELKTIAARLAREYPKTNKDVIEYVVPYNDQFNGGQIRIVFLAMLGAVGFVLLIVCANIANLLLARGITRAREVSIRAALGAGRLRIVRQLLIESLLLSAIGGLAGLALSYWGVRMFSLAVDGVGKPYWIDFTMDFTVFAYLAVICIATGVLFGLAPAWSLTRGGIGETLKEAGRGNVGALGSRWLVRGLVVAEIALSVVLLAGAGLMIRSFFAMYRLDLGVDASSLAMMRVELTAARYPKPEQRMQFADQLERRLAALPEIAAAAAVTNAPLNGGTVWRVEVEGDPQPDPARAPLVSAVSASGRYLDTLDLRLASGRGFTDTDGLPGRETAIVTRGFAQRFWPGESPLGRRLRFLPRDQPPGPWITVAGVAPDIRQETQRDPRPVMFLPLRQESPSFLTILARTRTDPAAAVAAMRREVAQLDAELPVFGAGPLEDRLAESRWPFRVFGTLFAVFAAFAMLLAAVGIYAVMAFSVDRRTGEIGLRMALGAESRSIFSLVLRQGLWQAVAGVVLGLGAAFGLTRVLAELVVVSPSDPLTFAVVTAVLAAVCLLACCLPARRAMKVDPMVALRYE